ncbi:MAG TPA: TlpA family protein disulfide reductase [Campylobacterales bacterium]|nr:TlpA family protein disulfide reductase [Campylobacterales bacterium]
MIQKITFMLFVLLFTACTREDKAHEKPTAPVKSHNTPQTKTEPIESLFNLTTITGETIHIDETQGGLVFHEFRDQVVMFVFFGYRCPPCLAEIPALIDLEEQSPKDLTIIGLEVQGLNQSALQNFAQEKGINYHLIEGQAHREFVNYIIQKANWQGSIPFLLAFDKQGVVKVVHVGGLGAEQFHKIYEQLSQ